MFFTILLVLLVLDALILIPVVLLQAGKGGGLAAMGGGAGTDTLFGSRHATTILTKTSWWAGGAFLTLAFVLSLMSAQRGGQESILRQELQNQPAAPAPKGTAPGAPVAPGVTAPAQGTQQGAQTPAATTPAAPAPAPAPAEAPKQ